MQAKAAVVVEETCSSTITKEEYEDLLRMLRASKIGDNLPKANMSGKNNLKAYINGKITTPHSWIIDSGASEHITPHKEWLKIPKLVKIVVL